jgi:hypothetical protein
MKIQKGPPVHNPPKGKPQKPEPPDPLDSLIPGGILGIGGWMAGTAYPTTYVHELGHKIAINALYEGANPTISVKPFGGGATRWSPRALSPLGKQLGAVASRATVAMAGTAMDALSSVALFAAGYKIKKSHPILGTSMMCFSAMNMLNSAAYAASGIGKTMAANPGHDFLTLQSLTGLPCWASTLIVASLLPATYLVMRSLDKDHPTR